MDIYELYDAWAEFVSEEEHIKERMARLQQRWRNIERFIEQYDEQTVDELAWDIAQANEDLRACQEDELAAWKAYAAARDAQWAETQD